MKTSFHPTARTACLALVASLACLGAGPAAAQTWLNGSGQPAECDFCILQFPSSLEVVAGQASGQVFGRVFESGVTESFGDAGLSAQLGFGALGSDPRDGGWTWINAGYGGQQGNEDEYVASFGPMAAGSYGYTFRFSFDGGQSYTLADLNGAGSNASLALDLDQLGTLTVTAVPEPGSWALMAAGLGVLGGLARRRAR